MSQGANSSTRKSVVAASINSKTEEKSNVKRFKGKLNEQLKGEEAFAQFRVANDKKYQEM